MMKDMATLSKLAYIDDENILRAELNKMGYELVVKGSKKEVDYYIAKKDNKQYVIFRGSEAIGDSIEDWVRNFDFKFKEYKKIKFHKGFLSGVLLVFNDILDNLDLSLPIYVSGHSQGASLAGVFNLVMFIEKNIRVINVDFSPAKIVDQAGVNFFNKNKLIRYWFSNSIDPVKIVPFYFMGYRHTGNFMFFDAKGELVVNPSYFYRAANAITDLFLNKTQGFKDHDINIVEELYKKNYDKFIKTDAKYWL